MSALTDMPGRSGKRLRTGRDTLRIELHIDSIHRLANRHRTDSFAGRPHGAADALHRAAILAKALKGKGVVAQHHRLARLHESDRARRHQQLRMQAAAFGNHHRQRRFVGNRFAAVGGNVGEDAGDRRTDDVLALGRLLHTALLQLAHLALDLIDLRPDLGFNQRQLGASRRQFALDARALALQTFELHLLVEHVVAKLDQLAFGIELVLVQIFGTLILVARRRQSCLLGSDLEIGLRQLALQIVHLAAQDFGLLSAEQSHLQLLALESADAITDFALHQLARGDTGRGDALERQADQRLPDCDILAFLREKLGDRARLRREQARGAGVECKKSIDALAARVLTPDRERDERDSECDGEQRVSPHRNRARERYLAQQLLALRVDRLLPEELGRHCDRDYGGVVS